MNVVAALRSVYQLASEQVFQQFAFAGIRG